MRKKLKIALFFSSDPAEVGGVQEHVHFLIKSLIEFGHSVDVFGPHATSFKWNFPNYTPICEHTLMAIPNGNTTALTTNSSDIDEIVQRITNNYDILHIHEPYNPFTAWKLILECSLPKVMTFHTAWNDESVFSSVDGVIGLFKKQYSKSVQGNIYVSDSTMSCWNMLSDPSVREKVITHGVDSVFCPPKKRGHSQSEKIELLFLARVVKRKGLQYLLDALSYLPRGTLNTLHLTVVGNGTYLPTVKKRAKKLGLENVVSFVGAVHGDDRVTYYQQADIFCAPYSDEAFGMTVLEAMACGCTIVGFQNDGFVKMLDTYPYLEECIVEQKNTGQLAEAIERAVSNRVLRKKASTWALKKSKEFLWSNTAKQTADFYYECISDFEKNNK